MKKLTNEILMMFIMEDIENLKVAGRFNQKYTPPKANFTNAMTESVRNTCRKFGIRTEREAKFKFSKQFRENNNRKCGYVDLIIYNPYDKKIALEIDSTNTNVISYNKLCELSADGYDSFWIIWNRNKSGKPFHTSYKDDFTEKNEGLGYTNKNVRIIRHTFHPNIYKPLT